MEQLVLFIVTNEESFGVVGSGSGSGLHGVFGFAADAAGF